MIFKKSFKKQFVPLLEKATKHKMFTDCKFNCITSDTFVIYRCEERFGDYMQEKLGGEPSYPQSLEITCEKDFSSRDSNSNYIALTIPFCENNALFFDLELELDLACDTHKARDMFSAVECSTTACDPRDEKINGLYMRIENVTEKNFDQKLDLLLDAAYTLLENM